MSSTAINKENVMQILEGIPDPEIPVITIVELGIVRDVEIVDGEISVVITPTYSGCPAMYAIESSIKKELEKNGITNALVRTVFYPAWTTEWITEEARQKLKKYGIAPPGHTIDEELFDFKPKVIACPFCESEDTRRISQFGSTPCKAQYYCDGCRQPFEYFKCH